MTPRGTRASYSCGRRFAGLARSVEESNTVQIEVAPRRSANSRTTRPKTRPICGFTTGSRPRLAGLDGADHRDRVAVVVQLVADYVGAPARVGDQACRHARLVALTEQR